MLGRTLNHYRIVEKLGSGGMGEVFAAEDTKLGRKVALKVLPPEMASPERRERFEREAKSVAAVNHPNIVQVFSVEEADGIRLSGWYHAGRRLRPGRKYGSLAPAGEWGSDDSAYDRPPSGFRPEVVTRR